MSKVKVNEPCPCKSGKKYKKCCRRFEDTDWSVMSVELQRRFFSNVREETACIVAVEANRAAVVELQAADRDPFSEPDSAWNETQGHRRHQERYYIPVSQQSVSVLSQRGWRFFPDDMKEVEAQFLLACEVPKTTEINWNNQLMQWEDNE